jgi:hypothetical protein
MSYETSAYTMYGVRVDTESAYAMTERLETPEARAVLSAYNVGYALAGPYDNDFLFLCKHFNEARMGHYTILTHPHPSMEADDRRDIMSAALELNLDLVGRPAWLVVPDIS